jgi:hypothetical protein
LSVGLAWPLLLEKPHFTKELWGPIIYQPTEIWESLCMLWLLYPFQWHTHSSPYWGQCGFPFVPMYLDTPKFPFWNDWFTHLPCCHWAGYHSKQNWMHEKLCGTIVLRHKLDIIMSLSVSNSTLIYSSPIQWNLPMNTL